MLTLRGNKIFLRALEPEDLDLLFRIENNEGFWEISTTNTPYSQYVLKQYLRNAHKDIYEIKQLRLVICKNDETPIGLIDVFNFEPKHKRAAIGILIDNEDERGKGYGSEALRLLCDYCFQHLNCHQVYANVAIDNKASQQLFLKKGFEQCAVKKDWNFVGGVFKDELTYQLIKNVH